MLKFLALVFPCLVLIGPDAAKAEAQAAPPIYLDCSAMPDEMFDACMESQTHRAAPCGGTLEQRLACLESEAVRQGNEIAALKRRLREQATARARPL